MTQHVSRSISLIASLLIVVVACISTGPPAAYAENETAFAATREIISVDRTTFFNEGRYINLEDHESALTVADFSTSGGSMIKLKDSGSKLDSERDRSPYATMQIPFENIRGRTTGVPGFGFVCDKTAAQANGASVSVTYDYVGNMKDIADPTYEVPVSIKATYTIRDGKTIAEEGDYQDVYNGHPVIHIPLCFSHGVYFCGTDTLDTHYEFFNAKTGDPLQLGKIYVTATSLNRGEGFALPSSRVAKCYVSNEAPPTSTFYNFLNRKTPYQVIPGSFLYDKSLEFGGGYTTLIGCPDIYDRDNNPDDFVDTIGDESFYWRAACFELNNGSSNAIDAKAYAIKTADWSGTSGIPGDSIARNGSMWFATNFLTLTSARPPAPTKTVDKMRGVRLGDTLTYRVSQQVGDLGADSFIRYATFSITDKLPSSLNCKKVRLLGPDGKEIVGAGLAAYHKESRQVSFEFSEEYLRDSMKMIGETYTLEIEAEVIDYPDDSLIISNSATISINGLEQTTNNVDTELVSPELTIEKYGDENLASAVNDFEFQPGDIVTYHATVKQMRDKTRAKSVSISDSLPKGLTLVAGSVTAFAGKGDVDTGDVTISEKTDGWTIRMPQLDYGQTVEITYRAATTVEGNGHEVINTASAQARNIAVGIAGNEFSAATDDAEIYINEPVLTVTEQVTNSPATGNSYEHRVDDTVTYSVTLENTAPGTFAKNAVVAQLNLPTGFAIAEDDDAVSFDGIACAGSPTQVLYPIHHDDEVHGELDTRDITAKTSITRNRSGVSLALNYLPASTPVTLTFSCVPTEKVNGMEIYSQATAYAENAPDPITSDPEVKLWINSPRISLEKSAPALAYQAGDIITYRIDVANSARGTVARNLTIEDTFETPGIELLRNSFVMSDDKGAIITDRFDIQQNSNDQRWKIETKNPLVHTDAYQLWHTSEGGMLTESKKQNPLGFERELAYRIEYQALITDAALAAQQAKNIVTVTSDEDLPVTDEEEVSVEGPALNIEKSADIGSYQVGDTAQYTLAITNLRTSTTAHEVVIEDSLKADEAGAAAIVEDSIEVMDGQMKKLSGWTSTWRNNEAGDHIGFVIDTHVDLENSVKLIVSYKMKFRAATPSRTVVNTACARANDAPEAKASCSVAYGEADQDLLSITKASDYPTYAPGSTALYTLTVKNTGSSSAAINPIITDTLKSSEYSAIEPGSISVKDSAGDTIETARITYREDEQGALSGFSIALGRDLPTHQSCTVTYRVRISDDALEGSGLQNISRARADNAKEVEAEHEAAVEGQIPPIEVDPLSVPILGYKTTAYLAADATSGSTVHPGEEIAYRVTARNTGAANAPFVRIRQYVPSGTDYVFDSASDKGVFVRSTKDRAAYVEWVLSDLAPEEERTVSLKVRVTDTVSEQIVSTAYYCTSPATQTAGDQTLPEPERVTAKTIHAVSTDDPARSIVNVVLSSIPVAGSAIVPGDTITYTLIATNHGGTTANDILVRDPLPEGSTYITGSASHAGFIGADEHQAEWLIPRLEPGESTEVSFRAEILEGTDVASIENQASFALEAGDLTGTTTTLENTSNIVEHPYPNTTESTLVPKTGDGPPLLTICLLASLGAGACALLALACSRNARNTKEDIRNGAGVETIPRRKNTRREGRGFEGTDEAQTRSKQPRRKRSRHDYLMWK